MSETDAASSLGTHNPTALDPLVRGVALGPMFSAAIILGVSRPDVGVLDAQFDYGPSPDTVVS